MPSRPFPLLSACALVSLAPCMARAATQPSDCAGPHLQVQGSFRERYPDLVEQLRLELPSRHDVDACAQVELQAIQAGIAVKVSLPDGRATVREVARAEDVGPTLRALLLVPERGAQPAVVNPAPVQVQTLRTMDRDTLVEQPTKPRESGFELSVVSGARVGDGQYGYGAGVLSFIELRRWLLGFQGRADGYRSLAGSDPETALALTVLLGRRFELGSYALDLTAGPALALRGASFSETHAVSVQAGSPQALGAAMATPPPQEPDVGAVPRLVLGARLGFSPRSVFRTFIGLDGELGPSRSGGAAQSFESSGRMPAYTVGLSLGATLGTR
jgi:hypothetical protein